MSKKQTGHAAPRRQSKRQRRMKIVVYVMVIAMVLSSLTAGLSMLL